MPDKKFEEEGDCYPSYDPNNPDCTKICSVRLKCKKATEAELLKIEKQDGKVKEKLELCHNAFISGLKNTIPEVKEKDYPEAKGKEYLFSKKGNRLFSVLVKIDTYDMKVVFSKEKFLIIEPLDHMKRVNTWVGCVTEAAKTLKSWR